jgi:hypothetical protein
MVNDESVTIKESLIEHLFTALSDPEAAVRSGALRLLVRLPHPIRHGTAWQTGWRKS